MTHPVSTAALPGETMEIIHAPSAPAKPWLMMVAQRIPALIDMPPMPLGCQVKDPAILEKVKAGDKVKFTVANINGAMTVLTLEPAKE